MVKFWQKITGKNKKDNVIEETVPQEPLEAVNTEVSETESDGAEKNIEKKVHQVSDKVSDVADVVVDQSKKIGKVVAAKTGEAVSYGRLKLKLYNQQHQLDKLYGKLGGTAFGLIKTEDAVLNNDDIQSLIGEIEDLINEIEFTKIELEDQPE